MLGDEIAGLTRLPRRVKDRHAPIILTIQPSIFRTVGFLKSALVTDSNPSRSLVIHLEACSHPLHSQQVPHLKVPEAGRGALGLLERGRRRPLQRGRRRGRRAARVRCGIRPRGRPPSASRAGEPIPAPLCPRCAAWLLQQREPLGTREPTDTGASVAFAGSPRSRLCSASPSPARSTSSSGSDGQLPLGARL